MVQRVAVAPELAVAWYLSVAEAALLTSGVQAFVDPVLPAVALRFLTGVALAGVYPLDTKFVDGRFRARDGFAIGALVVLAAEAFERRGAT